MNKVLLFIILIANFSFAQTLDLPDKLYLCQTGSLTLDGTVASTTDTGITYKWYYRSNSINIPETVDYEISAATNATLEIAMPTNEAGYYKVVATLTNGDVLKDTIRIISKNEINGNQTVECIEHYMPEFDFVYWSGGQNWNNSVGNIVIKFYEYEIDAIAGNDNNSNSFFNAYELYMRIEETTGQCAEIKPIFIDSATTVYPGYGNNLLNCSQNGALGVFDLTQNANQIISGTYPTNQNATLLYYASWNDFASHIEITNPENYQAVSQNQQIHVRVDVPGYYCQTEFNHSDFILVTSHQPTPNSSLDYIACDNTS